MGSRDGTIVPKGSGLLGGLGALMKDSVAVGVVTLAVVLGTCGIVNVVVKNRPADPPVDTSVRIVTSEPEFYKGRVVRLSSDGFEARDEHSLVYRKRAGTDPVVVATFVKPVPDPRPKRFTGLCEVRDGVVHLSGCTPSE